MGIGDIDARVASIDSKVDVIDTIVDATLVQTIKNGVFTIHTGATPGGNTVTSLVLDEGASSVTGHYDPALVIITSGLGSGQCRPVYEYDGDIKTIYIGRDWKVVPSAGDTFVILADSGDGNHVNEGVARGGGAQSVILNELASSESNLYRGQMIFLVAGTGQDQGRMCISYNGTTKEMTVDAPWEIVPDETTIYMMVPFPGYVHGRPTVDSIENILIRDIIGNKNDTIAGTSLVSLIKAAIVNQMTIAGLHDVPAQDSAANALMRDVLGNKDDTHAGNSVYARAEVLAEHAHPPYVYVFPNGSNGVTIAKAAGAWAAPPTPSEIIPANALDEDFDIHFMSISSISANGQYQVVFYTGGAGSEVAINDGFAVTRSAVQSQEGTRKVLTKLIPANTRVSIALKGSPAGTESMIIKVEAHKY